MAVEAVGVAPDVEVFQNTKEAIAGKYPQLERVVQEALKLLPPQGIELKKEPALPVRFKRLGM